MKTETVSIKFMTGKEIVQSVDGIDENHMLYGNFIGVQYVFAEALDRDCLAGAIYDLAAQFPALTGSYDRKKSAIVEKPNGVSLEIVHDVPGRAQDHCVFGTVQPNRRDFIIEPARKDVLGGTADLATFKLSSFEGGGCIFGMAISHVLVDAAAFHRLAKMLAENYSRRASKAEFTLNPATTDLGVFSFGTGRSKSQTLQALQQDGIKKPLKLSGPIGGLLKILTMRALDKMAGNTRITIHLSADDVARLKQSVLDESGEDWISTNVALSAHFTRIMARLMYGETPKTKVDIGQLLDLRGRYFGEDRDRQSEYIGNAILIYIEQAEFAQGVQNATRGELAVFFKNKLAALNAPLLKRRLDLVADSLRHGYTYPGLDVKDPLIALNNQSKMPVYDLDFAGSELLRVIPQDVGDNIMFFPTLDGGIEVYIRDILNPKRQEKLLIDEWQAEIFGF